jgi:signal transduction histidine kinase
MADTLHKFLAERRESILARAKLLLTSQSGCPPSEELAAGMPLLFEQLIGRLRENGDMPASGSPSLEDSAQRRGGELFRAGHTVMQVVDAYGTICQAIMGVAEEQSLACAPREFMVLNLALDNAIAAAVGEFQAQTSRLADHRHMKHLGMLAHALRNALASVVMAFHMVKKGVVTASGSTGGIIDSGLVRMRDLIDRALSEVRVRAEMPLLRERMELSAMVEGIVASLALEAHRRNVSVVTVVDKDVWLEADRQLLTSAVANLVQNAVKYTHRGSSIEVRGHRLDEKVRIEVEDECGGLPEGMAARLFQPFARHSAEESGVGLGLAVARQAVDAHGGSIRVEDVPGKGCVFTVELPAACAEALSETKEDVLGA